MLSRPAVYEGQSATLRFVAPGDVPIGGELIFTLNNAAGTTLSGVLLTSGIINRVGPVGAYNDTTDTAASIINAILGNFFSAAGTNTPIGIQNGTTFRLRYVNSVAFVMTLVAGVGITLGSNTALAGTSIKEYLLTVTNGTQPQVFAATTTNASAIVTGMNTSQSLRLSPGMLVTGTGIPVGTLILSVQPGIGITLSAAATATGTLVALNFSPTVRIDSLGQFAL